MISVPITARPRSTRNAPAGEPPREVGADRADEPPASANPATSSARAPPTSHANTLGFPRTIETRPNTPSDIHEPDEHAHALVRGSIPSNAMPHPRPITGNSTATRPSVACRSLENAPPIGPAASNHTDSTASPRAPSAMPSASRANGDRICTAGARCGPWAPAFWQVAASTNSLADRTVGCARRRTPRRGSLRRHGALSLTGSRAASSSGKRLGSSHRTAAHTSITTGEDHRLALRDLVEVAAQRAPDVLLQRRGVGDVRVGRLIDRGDHPRTGFSRMCSLASSYTKPRLTMSGPPTSSPVWETDAHDHHAVAAELAPVAQDLAPDRRCRARRRRSCRPARARRSRPPSLPTSLVSRPRTLTMWSRDVTLRPGVACCCRQPPCAVHRDEPPRTDEGEHQAQLLLCGMLPCTGRRACGRRSALRYRAPTRWIAGSLPGISDDDSTTVSPSASSPTCAGAAPAARAPRTAPLAPRADHDDATRVEVGDLRDVDHVAVVDLQDAERRAAATESPSTVRGTPRRAGRRGPRSRSAAPGGCELEKHAATTMLGACWTIRCSTGPTVRSLWVSGLLGVRGVAEQQVHRGRSPPRPGDAGRSVARRGASDRT